MTTSDRSRMMLAAAVTAVALPTLWISSRNESAAPRVAAVGAPAPAPVDGTEPPAETDAEPAVATEPATPAYLEGPPSSDGPATALAIASSDSSAGVVGTAGFDRFPSNFPNRACQVPSAPWGAVVSVRNLDSDRTTSCLNSSTAPTASADIAVLDLDVFLEIADLVDAPLPVELTW